MPMIMLGVPVEVFIAVAGVNLVYQFWVHTEHIGHLGWLEKIFITPMNQRIHHAKNQIISSLSMDNAYTRAKCVLFYF